MEGGKERCGPFGVPLRHTEVLYDGQVKGARTHTPALSYRLPYQLTFLSLNSTTCVCFNGNAHEAAGPGPGTF